MKTIKIINPKPSPSRSSAVKVNINIKDSNPKTSRKSNKTEPKDAFLYPRITEHLALAGNPETPPEILTKIIDEIKENQAIDTLAEIAGNPNTHPADLMRLTIFDKNITFRINLAENPNTPEIALRELVNDWRPDIRACIARNVNTPVDVLTLPAEEDNNILVRNALEENPNTPADILAKLKNNKKHWKKDMKPLKFRGKDLKGNWVYGYFLCSTKGTPCICDEIGRMITIDTDTLGQCTFVRDKNNHEIYEGDILKVTNHDEEETYNTEVFREGQTLCVNVTGQDYEYTSIDFADDAIWNDSAIEIEIIGNIHDNTNLKTTEKSASPV